MPTAPYAPSATAAPIIKWVGGKTKLLPELLARAPKSFGRYYEPFAGGAALFFRLASASKGPLRAVLNDANADLVTMYLAIQVETGPVITMLELHAKAHAADPQSHYYRVRDLWNKPGLDWSPARRAAAFIYLNKTCFNGLWRVNRSGGFNVPIGRPSKDGAAPRICDPGALRAAAAVLAHAELRQGYYQNAVSDAQAGDFVYFDPPYAPVNASSFTAYTDGDFGPDDQRALAGCARDLAARGVHVMLSNSDTPFVRSLYRPEDGFRVDQVMCGRAINSDGAKRGAVAEVIVTAGPGAAYATVDS